MFRKFLETFLKSVDNNSDVQNITFTTIERIAINPSGSIGSLYDISKDRIDGTVNKKLKTQFQSLSSSIKCEVRGGREPDCANLLKFLGMDYQLRFSILLEMTPAIGIAEIIHHSPPTNQYSRIVYIYQETSVESYPDGLSELKRKVKVKKWDSHSTYIITKIVRGIHLLAILQFPPTLSNTNDIDLFLNKLKDSLIANRYMLSTDLQRIAYLDQNVTTVVYSNISALTGIKKLSNIYGTIRKIQQNVNDHKPVKYLLTPLKWFSSDHSMKPIKRNIVETFDVSTLDNYLLQQNSELKWLHFHVNHYLRESLQGHCEILVKDILNKISELKILHIKEIEKLHHTLWMIRMGEINQSSLQQEISLDPPQEIEQLNKNIIKQINSLESKAKFIRELKKQGIEYFDVETIINFPTYVKFDAVKDILLGNHYNKVIFFANDKLREEYPEMSAQLYSSMLETKEKNQRIHLVYADFTYSSYKLEKMELVQSNNLTLEQTDRERKTLVLPSHLRKQVLTLDNQMPSTTNEYINILLIGESGVGKSTFINAFANYLYFESLDEAEKGKPIVIIPVSFVMTSNDEFEEKIIRFGHTDSNENHNNEGQSVTQKCKSYVFNISNERKLRIIDTPGFEDTRGRNQDELNLEEIFSFLHNINYLNGICLLFKPDVVRLNPYLQFCCTQLFDYFGENIRDHLIFCFTNARSTFFAPGNTRPLLKKFFDSFHVKNIPFEKNNTFCFDSESFRYLVAIKDSFVFESTERDEIQQTWTRSVTESKRFREFLCHQSSYRKSYEWQSIKDAQFQISFMIRPILESMRNIFRNILLHESNTSIELSSKPACQSSMLCYKCNRKPEKYNEYWILPDHLHNLSNMCASDQQEPTEYRLDYCALGYAIDESISDMNESINFLCETSGRLAQFLMENSEVPKNDPFLSGINRMIDQEKFICENEAFNDLNNNLICKLKELKMNYEQQMNKIKLNEQTKNLMSIYQLIHFLNEFPTITIQLNSIKLYLQTFLENNEHQVLITKDNW